MLVPFIGTGPVHGPMMLDAADSTVRLMLSLNVNVSRRGAGASSSRSCALVMNCGAGTMQEDHTRSLLKSQGSSRSCRQDTALGVHCLPLRPQRGGRLEESPVAVPGRDRRFRQSHPIVSCSPCHVHHKSVGGRLLKTRPRPATRKRYNLLHLGVHHTWSDEGRIGPYTTVHRFLFGHWQICSWQISIPTGRFPGNFVIPSGCAAWQISQKMFRLGVPDPGRERDPHWHCALANPA